MENMASNGTFRDRTTKSSKFMSMVPPFLKQDKDVQRMMHMIRQEEEKKALLMKEVKMKMEKVANQLTRENRRSGF